MLTAASESCQELVFTLVERLKKKGCAFRVFFFFFLLFSAYSVKRKIMKTIQCFKLGLLTGVGTIVQWTQGMVVQ